MDFRELAELVTRGNESIEAWGARIKALETQHAKRFGRLGNGGSAPGDPESVPAARSSGTRRKSKPSRATCAPGRCHRGESMSAGCGADGGYAVPTVIDAAIEAVLLEAIPDPHVLPGVQVSTARLPQAGQ